MSMSRLASRGVKISLQNRLAVAATFPSALRGHPEVAVAQAAVLRWWLNLETGVVGNHARLVGHGGIDCLRGC